MCVCARVCLCVCYRFIFEEELFIPPGAWPCHLSQTIHIKY